MHRLSHVGICTPVKPSWLAHLEMLIISLNGAVSPINCARKIPGPFNVFIIDML